MKVPSITNTVKPKIPVMKRIKIGLPAMYKPIY